MINLLGLAAVVLILSAVLAQQTEGECGAGKLCPSDKPCCSQYGACGVGAYCLGGCDPLHSNSLRSCVPAPSCNNQDYKLSSLDGITPNTEYLGDASKTKWVSSGTPKAFENQVLLTLSENGASSSGTLLATTSYVWYGKVSAQMKSSRGAGVVSAFILLSDVKDEIDFEFVGADLANAQSNYYFQGVTDYHNGANLPISQGNTFDTYHTYEFDWKPDQITWSIDGKVMRTVKKSDTFNSTTNSFHYPQTPSRVQLSLWPAGSPKNGKGTIEWAGGLVNWNSADVQANGYYYAIFKDVNVDCYTPQTGANVTGSKAYIYTSPDGTNSSVAETNDQTILKSLLGTGTDMNKDFPQPAKPSGTSSAHAPAATTDIAIIPGLSGAGPGTNGQRPSDTNNGNNGQNSGSGSSKGSGSNSGSGSNPGSGSGAGSGSGSGSDSGAGSSPGDTTPANSATPTGIGGFSQGDATMTKNSNNALPKGEKAVQGSVFAVLVAFMGMLVL